DTTIALAANALASQGVPASKAAKPPSRKSFQRSQRCGKATLRYAICVTAQCGRATRELRQVQSRPAIRTIATASHKNTNASASLRGTRSALARKKFQRAAKLRKH